MHRLSDVKMYWFLVLNILFACDRGARAGLDCRPCRCNDGTADCSNRNLPAVPSTLPGDISYLNISRNKMTDFQKGLLAYTSLRHIDASFNLIKVLHVDDFCTLSDLEILDLHSNLLGLSNDSYPKGVFRNQQKLRTLVIHNNTDSYESTSYYPDASFSHLKSLQALYIDGLKGPQFGRGFSQLQHLTTLKLTGHCGIRTLLNTTFMHTPKLQYLYISNCEITRVEASAFEPLRRILKLDISDNPDLGIPNLGIGLYGLQHSSLQVLKVNKLHRQRGIGLLLRSKDIRFLENITSLQELHLDTNRLELVEIEVVSIIPKSVQFISARENSFRFGLYLLATSALTGVKYVDSSGQHQSMARPFSVSGISWDFHTVSSHYEDSDLCNCAKVSDGSAVAKLPDYLKYDRLDKPWPGNFTIDIAPNLTFGNFSTSKISFPIFRMRFAPNNMQKLDLSYNFFTRWEGPIYGAEKLEVVDLSHNYCDYISNEFTTNLPSLKTANFSFNYLGYSLNNNSFSTLSSLEHLDLSNNKLNKIPEELLKNMTLVKHLDFSFNYLTTWNTNIRQCKRLNFLDISHNMLPEVPEFLRKEIDTFPDQSPLLKMSNNPFSCTCVNLLSLRWMNRRQSTFVGIKEMYCIDMNGNNQSFNGLADIVLVLEKNCASYLGVMVGILSIVVLALSLATAGIVYRYRWKLRYLYYLTRNRYRGYLPAENEQIQFEFDAFVSYADEDRGFVVRDMRQKLETEEGLRLCIHHRDFLPGEAIAANILNAVRSSRKTVVVLTKNFLKSSWCRYEVEMGKMESIHTGRNTLLILVFEEIPTDDLPADIVEIMSNDSYVEYTNDVEGQKVFWQNLNRAICSF